MASLFEFQVSDVSTFRPSSGILLTGAPLFWKKQITGKGIIIGILDSGIDSSHPDLKNKIIKQRDYVGDNIIKSKYHPHGTHVAGIIAANGKIKGVAPDAKIIDYRVLDVNGIGSFENISKAIIDATNDGCHIINLSLGAPFSSKGLDDALKYALSKKILVVAAAGNDGKDHISYPAAFPGVLSVGAIEYNITSSKITLPRNPWFSDSNKYVCVACDGWKVSSCTPNSSYKEMTGTSMASPHASGYAALILSSGIKKEMLYNFMKSSTVDILTPGRDDLSGNGLLTVYKQLPKYNDLVKSL